MAISTERFICNDKTAWSSNLFLLFSAAEMRWPEVFEAFLKQQNDNRSVVDLTLPEKLEILKKKNPITVSRMLDRFILSNANPIGKVKD